MNRACKWIKTKLGNLISESTRFRIQPAVLTRGNAARCLLTDRIGGVAEVNGEKVVTCKHYLCLDVKSAKELAEAILVGKGCLAV